ncbi:hypothetical protein T12_16224 [Trichinella patagoniensis]|uniref:Uncharacterized protein n=1 Tax=Trichinella patagoniensis TaxID=990121 RepID=A0A0V0ZIK5_9BILA|nr:hypothetical protein T12_16224 [Trichinella patagoniensis]
MNCLTVHSTDMQGECFPNLADGYQSNCYKSGCLIQARGDGSFCHHKTEDEFLAVMKVRKEAKCETELPSTVKQQEAVLGSKRVGQIPNYLSDYFLIAHTSTPSSFRAGTNEIPKRTNESCAEHPLEKLRQQLGIFSEHVNCWRQC